MALFTLEMSIALATGLLSGLIRGYTGFASGLFLVPIFAMVFGPIEGIAIAAIVSSIGGLQLLPKAIKSADWSVLLPPLVAAAITCFLTVGFLVSNDPATIKKLMGGFLIFAAILLIAGWKYNGPRSSYAGLCAGVLSGGALGGLGVPAGQFFALYFVSAHGNPVTQRAHIVVSAGLTIIFFLLGLIYAGKVVTETLLHATVLTPVFLFGVWAGAKLFQILPVTWFTSVVAWLVAATGVTILVS